MFYHCCRLQIFISFSSSFWRDFRVLALMFNSGSSCGDLSHISSLNASCDPSSSENDGSVSSYVLSPGGRKYYSPSVVDLSCVPAVNQVHDSLEKAFVFYKNYGRLRGFDVRKGTEETQKKNNQISRLWTPSPGRFTWASKNVTGLLFYHQSYSMSSNLLVGKWRDIMNAFNGRLQFQIQALFIVVAI
ncbi:hypothetical protein ACET3Z_005032 [Daucus carota]